MAADRTHDEILNEMVYAANEAFRHYGPGLSADGLAALRKVMGAELSPLWCDSCRRVDVPDGGEKDFHETLPGHADVYDGFAATVERMTTGDEG